jgi:hypothetical protein
MVRMYGGIRAGCISRASFASIRNARDARRSEHQATPFPYGPCGSVKAGPSFADPGTRTGQAVPMRDGRFPRLSAVAVHSGWRRGMPDAGFTRASYAGCRRAVATGAFGHARAPGWDRTSDSQVRNLVLCPLSYEGMDNVGCVPPAGCEPAASTFVARHLAGGSADLPGRHEPRTPIDIQPGSRDHLAFTSADVDGLAS